MTAGAKAGAELGAMTRRTVVAAGGAGLAAVLTACGGSDSDASGSSATGGTSGTGGAGSVAPPAADTPSAGGESAGADGGGQVLAKTTDIPEGGGKVFADQGIVVTQPKAGEFKAFSAMCTHQGCAVKNISDGVINCPCHGSKFDAADGSVKQGPATTPLAPASIKVAGDSITLA